jgi:acetyl esterase/lipase
MPLLPSCTAISFAVANGPAHFADVQRIADLSYGANARQKLDVYVPNAGAAAGKPVVVFFYGGAWDEGSRQQYRFAGAALAGLGYVTMVPDYRLYPEVRFPAFIDDAAHAVAWVRTHAAEYGADASRIIIIGHSAGAHTAAMLIADPHYLRDVAVDSKFIAGMVGLSGPYDLTPNTAELHRIFTAPFQPRDWQVTAHTDTKGPPTLLVHGADDTKVLSAVSTNYAAQLRALGSDVTLRIYPRCEHKCPLAALSRPARNRAPALADIKEFLARFPASH